MTWDVRWKRALGRRVIPSRFAARWVSRPRNGRGDELDPAVAVLLALDRITAAAEVWEVDARRAGMRTSCAIAAGPGPELPVEDVRLGGLRARAYGRSTRGGLVWLHGGGWVCGDLDTHDALCRRLAARSGRAVLAVDYPLAPEHRWPAPVHACREAWEEARSWLVARGVPGDRVALGGDSAGGNLTAAVCLLLRGSESAPERQVLVYPGLDATCSEPSHREFAEGFILSEASIRWYLAQYRPDPRDPLASPIFAEDLRGLPPCVLTVAGFDPLRDEGLRYAARLREAGVETTVFDERGQVHGYANMDGLVPEAGRAIDRIAASIAVE